MIDSPTFAEIQKTVKESKIGIATAFNSYPLRSFIGIVSTMLRSMSR